MKKKIFLSVFILLLSIGLVACGQDDNGDTGETEVETTIPTEETTAPESGTNDELEALVRSTAEALFEDWVNVVFSYDDDGELATVFLSPADPEFANLVSVAQQDVEVAEILLGSAVTMHNSLQSRDIEVALALMDTSGTENHVVFLIEADGTMVNARLATE